jgi:hypothetical protein
MATAEFRYLTTSIYQSGSTANPVISELPFTGVNFTSQLNSVGTFQGHVLLSGINTIDLNVQDGTIPGKTILWVLYSDPTTLVSIPVWSGVIWAREYDSASQTLSITAQEMLSLYDKRRISTTKDYTVNPLDANGYDPAYIAYQLMDYAEALPHGKTGLFHNNETTPYRVKKSYQGYELKSVYQAIKDLASEFFDFRIVPKIDPVTNALYNFFEIGDPLGNPYNAASSPVFQFPGNLVQYKFPEDASGAANKLYGLGYGANNTKVIATAIDNDKIGTGKTWPLLEDSANYIDIGNKSLLEKVTLGQLNAVSFPPTTIEIVIPPYVDPYYGYGYQVGDYVRLDIHDDYFPLGLYNSDGSAFTPRIVAISTNPGENGPSRITLTLTRDLANGSVQ